MVRVRMRDQVRMNAESIAHQSGLKHRLGRAVGNHSAFFQHQELLRVTRGEIQIVKDDQDANAASGDPEDDLHHSMLMDQVEAGSRFVEEQIARFVIGLILFPPKLREDARQLYALFFAARERWIFTLRQMVHSHRGQRFECDLVIPLRFSKMHMRRPTQQRDLKRGERTLNLEFLRQNGDALRPFPSPPAIERPPIQLNGTARCREIAGETTQ